MPDERYTKITLAAKKWQEGADLSLFTSFRTGGPADVLVEPQDIFDLSKILATLDYEEIPYYILGNGTNVLVKDGGFSGVIVRIGEALGGYEVEGDTITCGSGMLLSALSRAAFDEGLTGLEFASGIPGSVGGAVFMNAGAYDGEMKNILKSVVLMKPDGSDVYEVPAEELDLGYRHSRLMETGEIVLSATVRLQKGDKAAIEERMKELTKRRNEKQPVSYPSCGSFFKRPEGYFAGKLVQDAGLKGLRVGGAEVSQLHSGFLINIDHATTTDVLHLMHLVQARVKEQFGVSLEPEVRIIGEDEHVETDL